MMVNETLTPNLYNMMDKGIDFTSNYCKNKTNVSEYIGRLCLGCVCVCVCVCSQSVVSDSL